MKIYNSLTNSLENFNSIEKNKVGIYVCGPTVYNYIHIGNSRPIIVFDVLARYLKSIGYEVKFVQNFTDIDDKIIKKSIEEKVPFKDITEKYNKKELSAAHYSDIVRFSLLYQYGGIWMDATLFVSPYATLEMFEGDFFSLNHPPTHHEQIERTIGDFKWSGFFLAGKKEKTYFKHIYELYIYFVRKYSFFISYLMMDYFILS